MKVLLWLNENNNTVSTKFRTVVERVTPSGELELHENLDTVTQSLREYAPGEMILICYAATKDGLNAALSIRPLLEHTSIIMILPDSDKETIARGHLFGPRFLTDVNGDPEEVGSVLARLISHLKTNRETFNPKT